MLYKWNFPSPFNTSDYDFFNLQNTPDVIKNILINRNINSPEKLDRFIKPSLSDLHDPFLMADMSKAVNRVIKALSKGENILIYGDYDVDGVTGVSVLYDGLHNLGGKVSFFIPDRIHDGYGLSKKPIDKAFKQGVNLIIAVDCGISANQETDYANQLGMDVIVCDHHQAGEILPSAFAILNPKQKLCNYPFKELAGCGVAFKLLQGISQKLNMPDEFCQSYLDLVAIGTAADIVELIDENRIFAAHGLKSINTNPRAGVSALISVSGLTRQTITINLIVFVIAPRINAVGRISNAKKAVHLLTSKSPQQAKNIARILENENNKRKNIDELTYKEAEEIIKNDIDLDDTRVLVLAKKNWHLGVIGIVSSRILEKYNRPTVLISIDNGTGKASARSYPEFNIYEAFKYLENYLISYGGHACASGLTIKTENINLFAKKINEYARKQNEYFNNTPVLNIDAEMQLQNFNGGFLHWHKLLAPFGPQNMRPVFLSKGLSISGPIRVIGQNHLKFKIKQGAFVIDAIAYNMIKYLDIFENNEKFDFVYVVEESNWQGRTTVQLRLKDFEVINE